MGESDKEGSLLSNHLNKEIKSWELFGLFLSELDYSHIFVPQGTYFKWQKRPKSSSSLLILQTLITIQKYLKKSWDINLKIED